MQRFGDLTAHHPLDRRPHQRRRRLEYLGRSAREIGVVEPAPARQNPIEVILAHFFDRPADRALFRRQMRVEIDASGLFDMPADEGGIGDERSLVVDIGQLALGRLGEAVAVFFIVQPGEFEQQHRLHDKGADIRQAGSAAKTIERDHGALSKWTRVERRISARRASFQAHRGKALLTDHPRAQKIQPHETDAEGIDRQIALQPHALDHRDQPFRRGEQQQQAAQIERPAE